MVTPAMTQEIRAKYTFTMQEIQDLGGQLAAAHLNKNEILDQKRSMMSDFKDRLDRVGMEIQKMSNARVLGYEFRTYRCKAVKDYDEKVIKFYDVHTDVLIDTRPFESEDYQQDFISEEYVKPVAGESEPKPSLKGGARFKKHPKKGKR